MPVYKRKRSYGGRARRVKPRAGRRMFRSRRVMPRKALNINKAVVRYGREIPFTQNMVIPVGANFNGYGYHFTLEGWLPNYTEFTALFDQYRLRSVLMKMRLVSPPEANNTPVTLQYYPDVVITVDHDDSTAPGDVDSVRQYGKAKCGILKPNTWFKYKCYPMASMQMYTTPTTTGYAPTKNTQWMDLAYTAIRYYGIKIALDASSLGTLQNALVVEARAYLVWEFKSSR